MSKKVLHTDKEVRIAFDPYRMRILEVFFIHKKKPMTAKMVADILDELPSKVNYHIQQLVKIDVLELDHTELIFGITAKYYILPYDAVVLDKDHVSKNLFNRTVKDTVETNFHISLARFEQDLEKGRKLRDDNVDKDQYFAGTQYFSLYIKEEEYEDVQKRMFDVLRPYTTKEEGCNTYKTLMSIVKVEHGNNDSKK